MIGVMSNTTHTQESTPRKKSYFAGFLKEGRDRINQAIKEKSEAEAELVTLEQKTSEIMDPASSLSPAAIYDRSAEGAREIGIARIKADRASLRLETVESGFLENGIKVVRELRDALMSIAQATFESRMAELRPLLDLDHPVNVKALEKFVILTKGVRDRNLHAQQIYNSVLMLEGGQYPASVLEDLFETGISLL